MDILTFLTILNGIEYLILLYRIGGRWYNFTTINRKIAYFEKAKMFYDIIPQKKKISNIYNKMNRLMNCVSSSVNDYTLYRLERKIAKREREHKILQEGRKKRQMKLDLKKEKELYDQGFLMDALSKHYIPPDELLKDICNALVLKSPGDKEVFEHFILNEDNQVFDEDDFGEIRKHLIYVKVADRLTGLDFRSALLHEPVYSPSTIIWLQEKCRGLYKLDMKIIRTENNVVPSLA